MQIVENREVVPQRFPACRARYQGGVVTLVDVFPRLGLVLVEGGDPLFLEGVFQLAGEVFRKGGVLRFSGRDPFPGRNVGGK